MSEASDERATPDWLRAALDALERGDWRSAHELVQDEDDLRAAWVHAHLHRVEGDEANAAYWYRRARRAFCHLPLEQERVDLRAALLR